MTLLPGLRSLVGGPPRLRAVYGSPILIVAGRLDALEQDRGRVEVALQVTLGLLRVFSAIADGRERLNTC